MPKILILEDQPLIAILLQDWLTELGCETVGPAHSVKVALEIIPGAVLDGAILDVSIGDENSYPVADELFRRGIPVAFSTGHGAGGLDSRFANALVLPKPFDFAAVKDVVATLLDDRRRN
jgi:CheY-like chemotaxis protein